MLEEIRCFLVYLPVSVCLSVCLPHDTVYSSRCSGQAERFKAGQICGRSKVAASDLSPLDGKLCVWGSSSFLFEGCWRLFRRIQNGLCVALTTRTAHRPPHRAKLNYVKGKFDLFSSQVSAQRRMCVCYNNVDQMMDFVNKVMKFLVLWNSSNFLVGWAATGFSRVTDRYLVQTSPFNCHTWAVEQDTSCRSATIGKGIAKI